MAASLQKFLVQEVVTSIGINVVLLAAATWIALGGAEVISLWGRDGYLLDLVPSTVFPILMMSLVLPVLIRKKVRAGRAPQVSIATLPGFLRLFPANLAGRAIVSTIVFAGGLLVLVALTLIALQPEPQTFSTILSFKLAYGVVFSILVTPFIALRALAD